MEEGSRERREGVRWQEDGQRERRRHSFSLPTAASNLHVHTLFAVPGKAKARLSTAERILVTWLVVTAAVHLVVEGK